MIRGLFLIALAWLPLDRLVPLNVGFMTLTPFYILIVFTAVCVLVEVLRGRIRYRVNSTDAGLGAVCVLYLCSTLLARDIKEAGLLAFGAIFIPSLTYFIAKALLTSTPHVVKAGLAFSLGLAALAVAAVVQFLAFDQRPRPFGQDGIAFASLAVLPVMIGLYGADRSAGHKSRLALIGPGLTLVAVSLARAYWIFLLVSPLLLWLFKRGRAFAVVVVMLAASLAATLAITFDENLIGRVSIDYQQDRGIQRVFDPDHWRAALFNRSVFMYQQSLDAFTRYPIFGQGLFVHSNQATTTHNVHLEWLESGGILGYGAFLFFFLSHFRRLGRYGRDDNLACAAGLASVAILMNGVTNGIMHSVMPTCLMLSVGIAAGRLQSLAIESRYRGSTRPMFVSESFLDQATRNRPV